ncbi:MAG: metalloregulator ArsR/SmtB family transcription factor [Actinomycetota bacterium]
MAHPLRLSLLSSLVDEPKCVHELVESSGATQPLVSQHLRVLRAASLVRSDRRGREVVYAIADTHIHHIVIDAVDHVRTEGDHHGPHVHDA